MPNWHDHWTESEWEMENETFHRYHHNQLRKRQNGWKKEVLSKISCSSLSEDKGKYWKSFLHRKTHENACDATTPNQLTGIFEFNDKHFLFRFAPPKWFKFYFNWFFSFVPLLFMVSSYVFMILLRISMLRFYASLCLFRMKSEKIWSFLYQFVNVDYLTFLVDELFVQKFSICSFKIAFNLVECKVTMRMDSFWYIKTMENILQKWNISCSSFWMLP